MQATELVTVTSEGVTVSSLIWARFKRPMPGLVEQTLDANKGLADALEIPVGTQVRLPIPEESEQPQVAARIELW